MQRVERVEPGAGSKYGNLGGKEEEAGAENGDADLNKGTRWAVKD